MGLRELTDKAKQRFEDRGGTDRLKQDREALRDIARGEGSLSEKAKAGLERLREEPAGAGRGSGEPGEAGAARAGDTAPPAETKPHPDPGAPPPASGSTEPSGVPPSRP